MLDLCLIAYREIIPLWSHQCTISDELRTRKIQVENYLYSNTEQWPTVLVHITFIMYPRYVYLNKHFNILSEFWGETLIPWIKKILIYFMGSNKTNKILQKWERSNEKDTDILYDGFVLVRRCFVETFLKVRDLTPYIVAYFFVD